ncbi:MAG: hypothetical protein NTW37_22135 [Proteobacteria bacterium]|nr:hypothetical protein [Pseudomonadota bacterium]
MSLAAAAALLVLALLLFLVQPDWDTALRWQVNARFKTVTGWPLLALMAAMWLPVALRGWFNQPRPLAVIKLVHQWLGVFTLVVLLLHANLSRSGYLAILSLCLFVAMGSGALLSWMQDRGWVPGRRWLMAAHITLAWLVSSSALLHLYFVLAYAG